MITQASPRPLQNGGDLYALFLKTNESERADKFFEITSSVDMFGCHTLSIEKGKRTGTPRNVIRGYDTEAEAQAEFLRLCKLRISHGYEMRQISAPGILKNRVMEFLCDPKRQSEDFDQGNRMMRAAMNLIYRSLLAEDADDETVRAFRKKLNATDPQAAKGDLNFGDLLGEGYDTIRNKALRDENIEIIRYFIEKFTAHDLRLRRSLIRALTTPQTIHGPNVIQIETSGRQKSFVLSIHVMEAFARESIHTKIPLKLIDAGIQRLEQLTKLTWDDLREVAGLSYKEAVETDRICGAFGLQLKTGMKKLQLQASLSVSAGGPNSGADSTVCL